MPNMHAPQAPLTADQLAARLPQTAFAFRGYNVTNLGRSHELLVHPLYGPVVEQALREAAETCAQVAGRPVDLVSRVVQQRETSLETYDEAIALVMALEMAQLQLCKEFFGVDYRKARVSLGYSLGEVVAVVAGGVMPLDEAMRVPLAMARDAADLAADVTLGVLFSRGRALPLDDVHRLCLQINREGRGVIGVSGYLSPNSLLLMGQQDTLDRFRRRMKEALPRLTYLRKNDYRWPPMHTPIVWQRNIPNRSAVMMHTMAGGFTAPQPPVLSLVTGKCSYHDYNARELLHHWADHPQRLWDAVYETLSMGIETIVHVGPQPNIIPSTYKRLRDNVEVQTRGSIGMRALSAVVGRPWLSALLPERTALLRALSIRHVMLEDWLLEQPAAAET